MGSNSTLSAVLARHYFNRGLMPFTPDKVPDSFPIKSLKRTRFRFKPASWYIRVNKQYMANKPKRPWTVRDHSDLKQIDDNLWAVEDVMANQIHRRMCIIKRTDGSLLFFHAIPLNDATLDKVKALGKPEYYVLGHDQHTYDAYAFQQKLGLKAYGPKDKEVALKARLEMTGSLEDIPADASMEIFSMPGTKHGETVILLKSGGGARTSVLTTDVIQNNPLSLPFYFRWLGFAGGPKVVPIFKMLFVSDKKAIKETFLKWAAIPGLKRIVPFHGDIEDNDATGALKRIAEKL